MDTSPEDVAKWLARETGHVPEATEDYDAETNDVPEPRKIGLPQDNHEKLRRFFDGLHIEKALTEKRRNEALNSVNDAEQMNEALKQATPQGGQY